ncbi:MAG: hypothetical protein J6M62_10420 [Selenomonadaceae bacterium]|nr:hypothetical protein [Selenomonadaceae bacterium]
MSNVHLKDREETPLTFVVLGRQIQIEVTKIVMSEKSMPKKYRMLVGTSLINKVDEMMDNIIMANSIYAKDEKQLARRDYYQELAIINCFQIQNKLIRIEKCVPEFKVNRLSVISELLKQETETLKRWRRSNKLVSA